MSKVVWEQGSQDPSDKTFQFIVDWWTKLDGQRVEWRYPGLQISPNGEEKELRHAPEPFTLGSPTLDKTTLSFSKSGHSQSMVVNRLELDTQKQELRVVDSTGKLHAFVKSRSGPGSFRIEGF